VTAQKPMARISLGPLNLDICDTSAILEKTGEFIRLRIPSQIVTLNALMFNTALRDKACLNAISNASLVVPDSTGIAWAVRFLTGFKTERLAGIDLLNELCGLSARAGHGIFLLGAKPGVAATAALNLAKRYPGLKIAGTRDGYFDRSEEEDIVKLIEETSPDILFVGFEIPKQEIWISDNLARLKVPVVMGVGGSFDVVSGGLIRAPLWVRKLHLEWFFRFLQQPWRISRLFDLPAFVFEIFTLKFNEK